ncbi:CD1871A family CXXC motif-containing protein [Anaerovorax odorimutans]|uniref:CD1871A family CXXC motif-containing protein n=1 Tax=Anaerovorax odorimutans TaxID=109327 RepID=A0ABT1RLJ2_9FIRM|nr:CD1871A family CXXC motif-containing protein [Anaerovorax odorimutans]MCQ4636042.1 CD1871A family CXXC motif-containing protein [Anaerovorax odorimutans]
MKRKLVFSALLVFAAVLMAGGLMRGEGQTVLMKAVNICLECIGIG